VQKGPWYVLKRDPPAVRRQPLMLTDYGLRLLREHAIDIFSLEI